MRSNDAFSQNCFLRLIPNRLAIWNRLIVHEASGGMNADSQTGSLWHRIALDHLFKQPLTSMYPQVLDQFKLQRSVMFIAAVTERECPKLRRNGMVTAVGLGRGHAAPIEIANLLEPTAMNMSLLTGREHSFTHASTALP